jgi:hypothetical protein
MKIEFVSSLFETRHRAVTTVSNGVLFDIHPQRLFVRTVTFEPPSHLQMQSKVRVAAANMATAANPACERGHEELGIHTTDTVTFSLKVRIWADYIGERFPVLNYMCVSSRTRFGPPCGLQPIC